MKALKWIDLHIEEVFLTIFLIALTCLIMANVILRYVFGSGLNWAEAMCRYCLVYSCFFSIAHWIRRCNGISVDALVNVLPEQVREVLSWIVQFFMIVFFGILLIASVRVMKDVSLSGMIDGTMGFSMSYIYFACCIGFFDALIRSIQVFVIRLTGKDRKEDQ